MIWRGDIREALASAMRNDIEQAICKGMTEDDFQEASALLMAIESVERAHLAFVWSIHKASMRLSGVEVGFDLGGVL